MQAQPTAHLFYSHGGPVGGVQTPVSGTVTGRGRTIEITQASECVPLYLYNIGSGDVTFRLVCNGTLLGANFQPDPAYWINAMSAADITLPAGTGDVFTLINQIPYWATQVTAVATGGNLVSFARNMLDRTARWVCVKYPDAQSEVVEF